MIERGGDGQGRWWWTQRVQGGQSIEELRMRWRTIEAE